MSKFSMKDYENFLEEESRQDRLQEKLEDQRNDESYNDYQVWLQKQEEERQHKEMVQDDDWDDGYWDDDDYYCMADLLDAYVPEFEDFSEDTEESYDNDSCYMYPRCDMCSCYPCAYSLEMQSLAEDINDVEFERIRRKAVSRNRHLNNVKAKRRAQKSAEILKRRFQRLCPKTEYEKYRLYTRQAAAVKKSARVKAS